ncbi:alpha/beta hydrolase [Corynebacterium uberis]|uniref:alpha/beta hydrolase n=1 Tax=Corynebacterium TaxID=1716 RepID=UPI001D0A5D6A|nr:MULTISPECIES: alpha/beta hydrolase family protein [Corynebacterium]MCZ9309600.1 esterase family protein [Corynebacterium sp. c6VSa_13]UDL73408.1 esterase family protein [Corynebacterium uberis]UDL75712.1 esterase family protein [Corynebacterium uberis]UDL77924.1 esterase family protein [Corynebacterium uberis]UDL80208.1 esterase family protein [Corynebacterium uberis]
MSILTGLRRRARGLRSATAALASVASVTAVASVLAAGLSVVGGAPAQADNRDWLRPDATGQCEWDAAMYWVQRCDVPSAAMGKAITVQIQPAGRGGNAGLYLLDGLRATNISNAWLTDANAAATYEHDNITLVMPVGGAGSFYADWDGPATFNPLEPVNYQWETFLTQELPTYLESNFGVARNNNSIIGLSMGGTAAVNLASKHPDQFRQVQSYSGYLTTTVPGAQTLMRVALLDAGGFNLNAMYGSIVSPRRFDNDPLWNMDGLRNSDVYISAASGIPDAVDAVLPPNMLVAGSPLEMVARGSTQLWSAKAHATGLAFSEDYPVFGLHNWRQFNDQLVRNRERVLNYMNAW